MKSFEIFFTSDTHGKVLPVDYATGMKKDCGLLNIARDIQKRNAEVSIENTIFVPERAESGNKTDRTKRTDAHRAVSIEENKRFFAETEVIRDGMILPFSEMKRDKSFTSL